MIISRTPFRVSFFGGGTDYPAWYRKESGMVLSTTIDKYCYLTCRKLPPFFEYSTRIVYAQTELVNHIDEIKHPAVRETLRHLKLDGGIEVHHAADLPARTGLGASSAFVVGLLHILRVFQDSTPGHMDLAQTAIHIERDCIKEAVGSQDQTATSFGGLNQITFSGDDEIQINPISLEPERISALESHLMLYFTGLFRSAPQIAAQQIKEMDQHRSELLQMRQMVEEAIRILVNDDKIEEFGKLLHESWQLKRQLAQGITNPTIDEIYQTAMEAGALGGKVLGAGGGGFMLFFVPAEHQSRVRERLSKLVKVPFRFEHSGTRIILNEHR
jgi:D-glycero-alpha-D-manno-heptose-7-phosphate kinase